MNIDAPALLDASVIRAIAGGGSPDLLDQARGKLGIRHMDERGPAEYLRALRPGPEADLIASSLLRLLAGRYSAVDDSPYRNQIVDFLDGQYAQALRAHYKQPRRRNAYEVLNALAPVAPAVEEIIAAAISRIVNLDSLEIARQEMLKAVGSPAGRVILRPFLPTWADGEVLTDLFATAISVRDAATVDEIGQADRSFSSSVEALLALVEEQPTSYGRRFLAGIGDALSGAVGKRMELFSPPARIVFMWANRPMPLLEPGVTCEVHFSVTNEGQSAAENLEITAAIDETAVISSTQPTGLGRLEPASRREVTLSLLVREPAVSSRLAVDASWTNRDHTVGRTSDSTELRAHEVHIDWSALETQEPYAPYPVDNRRGLVGRERQLQTLINYFTNQPLANLYVTGQRRVGKTSLIRVLTRELASHPNLLIASVEMGEARTIDEGTIGALGRKLAERLVRGAGLEDHVPIPSFDDSLAPLTDVVEAISEWDEHLAFLFVIDEFDELPHPMYRRDGPGDALFVPMRSLAQKPAVGWLLVGGEKMPFIRDEQAARLNTFREVRLDYLSLGDVSDDRGFAGLVRQPLPVGFAVDEAAIRTVFDQSAGNPHFAKEICASMFTRAVGRRDAVVGSSEMQESTEAAAREKDVELFAHFWEDGIFESEAERRRIELQRRSVLIACAETLRSVGRLDPSSVERAASNRGLSSPDTQRLLTEFVRRGVFEEQAADLRVKVPFFQQWLEAEGIYRLPPRGISEQVVKTIEAEDARLRVGASEVRRLVARWDKYQYRGQQITRDGIDLWLGQFETPLERRVAFRMLERLRPITDAEVHSGFRRLQRIAAGQSATKLRRGHRTITTFYVAALGSRGSSGDSFTYSYRQANNIHGSNVVQIDNLIERLGARHEVDTVVFVDDFIGSGGTAVTALGALAKRAAELTSRPPVHWFLFAVAGLPEGVQNVLRSPTAAQLDLRVEVAYLLSEGDLPLHSDSTVFPDPDERESARRLMLKYGQRHDIKFPLGFGEQAALVAFPENCPNNAPGILWSDSGDWIPLLRRTAR